MYTAIWFTEVIFIFEPGLKNMSGLQWGEEKTQSLPFLDKESQKSYNPEHRLRFECLCKTCHALLQ